MYNIRKQYGHLQNEPSQSYIENMPKINEMVHKLQYDHFIAPLLILEENGELPPSYRPRCYEKFDPPFKTETY